MSELLRKEHSHARKLRVLMRDVKVQEKLKQLRELTDEDVVQELKQRCVNSQGEPEVLRQRLLRYDIIKHIPNLDTPWHDFDATEGALAPDWDY